MPNIYISGELSAFFCPTWDAINSIVTNLYLTTSFPGTEKSKKSLPDETFIKTYGHINGIR